MTGAALMAHLAGEGLLPNARNACALNPAAGSNFDTTTRGTGISAPTATSPSLTMG